MEPPLSHSVGSTLFAFRCHHDFFWETPLWCLDLIQLWIWITRITHLMMDDLRSFVFFWPITHLVPYWGIFRFGWDLRIFMESHDRLHLLDTCRDEDLFIILSWSSSGASLEPLNRVHTFCIQMSSCFLLGDSSLMLGPDSVVDLDYQDHTFDNGWFEVVRSFDLSHIWCHTWAYFPFRSRFVYSHWFAWSSLVMRYASGWWFSFILSWLSGGLSLESFRQAHTFWFVMILGWSYSRRIGSHITISVEYMSDLLYIAMELFSSYQDRPDTSGAILGHISFLQL